MKKERLVSKMKTRTKARDIEVDEEEIEAIMKVMLIEEEDLIITKEETIEVAEETMMINMMIKMELTKLEPELEVEVIKVTSEETIEEEVIEVEAAEEEEVQEIIEIMTIMYNIVLMMNQEMRAVIKNHYLN